MRIGITERGDAGLDQSWRSKLDTVDGVILITKSPHLLGDVPDKAIVHCTITGFGGTRMEPGVLAPDKTLPVYENLVDAFGGDRIILRIDPIIPTEKGIEVASKIFARRKGRVRISFIDNYKHVDARFKERNIPRMNTNGELHYPLSIRKQAMESFEGAEVCGEPGISCQGCISKKDLNILGISAYSQGKSLQRKHCMCIAEKVELLSNKTPCSHNCAYCYWK